MKKKLLPLLIITGALSLSGCSFFSFISNGGEAGDWDPVKQTLDVTQDDLFKHHYYDVSTMPTKGNPKLLVIPVWLNDSASFVEESEKDKIVSDLEKTCFGSEEETGWQSISSFYKTESFEKCVIEGEVAPWYYSSYSYDSIKDSDTTSKIVKSAVNDWKANNPEKVTEYDSDKNGYIDGVIIIYAAPDYSRDTRPNKRNTNMWAYTSWLETDSNVDSPNANVFIWASYDFMYADTEHGLIVDAHTYIHEMGHVFGLDDYYDYAEKGVWAGGFSMQDYNVGGHDPFSLLCLGWVDPYVPTGNATITLKPFVTSGEVIVLSPDFSSNSAFSEYIIIEYYSPTGLNEHDSTYQYLDKYPVGPNRTGIRIWHVDARLLKIMSQKNRRGESVDTYTIVETIDPNEGSYLVGCTNTTYVPGADTNSYCSVVSSLRNYKLLELIRRGDYTATYTDEYLKAEHLFKSGDTFTSSRYSGYFHNSTRLDNDKKFSWSVTINTLTNDEAKISVSL